MIDYIEVRNHALERIGIIDIFQSVIWKTEYYGCGEFEIYAKLTPYSRERLTEGNYVTKPADNQAGIIEAVEYTDDTDNGAMIIAKGRMCKSLIDRRLAYQLSGHTITPVKASGNVAQAVQGIVQAHAGATASAARTLGIIQGSDGGITKVITAATDEEENSTRQSSYQNLLEFTDNILHEYECGSYIKIDGGLVYDCYEGKDKSMENTAGNSPVIFSLDFDNLLSADYVRDSTSFKNFALIGGEGQGLDRFYATLGSATGFERRETFVNAVNVPRKYMDGDTEKTYTDAQYTEMLTGQAATELTQLDITEKIECAINLARSPFKFGADFWLGDIVTIQDERLGLYANVRVLSATEVQDEGGYNITIEFGGINNG